MPRQTTSYRGLESVQGERLLTDAQLIPVFDGSRSVPVAEWLEKVDLVCRLRGIEDPATVMPVRLAGSAFVTYMQLPVEDRTKAERIKEALTTAFAVDAHVAYEQFISRKLRPGEQPDLFLAELRRLAATLDGVSEKLMSCAFVAGLPAGVRQLLRAGCRIEEMSVNQILVRARAVMVDDAPMVNYGEACLGMVETRVTPRPVSSGRRCFSCGGVGRFAKDCPTPRLSGGRMEAGWGSRNSGGRMEAGWGSRNRPRDRPGTCSFLAKYRSLANRVMPRQTTHREDY
uniref:CCHC-type domain-containing protein n=1 Tax=Trichuris muris TaxID=70415 RepID=A0A5S6R522_TRIMR